MCTVSYVGDHGSRTIPDNNPWIRPIIEPQPFGPAPRIENWFVGVSQVDFDKLKAEVEGLKKLLLLAKHVDEVTGQPDCEIEEKVALLKRVAEIVGVSLEDVFGAD